MHVSTLLIKSMTCSGLIFRSHMTKLVHSLRCRKFLAWKPWEWKVMKLGTMSLSLQEVIDLNPEQDRYKCLGLDRYPIFNEEYRVGLNEKIIAHFNEQEIAHETDSMFKYAMARKMNEIMPLYNQHYLASQIEIDPLLTVNMQAVATGTVETDTTDATTSNSNTE